MRRLVLCLAALLWGIGSLPSAAQESPVPERRVLQYADTDFFGDDLRAIFETTRSACHAACLADRACTALTFNSSAGACFLKSGAGEPGPYDGALAAEVLVTPPEVVSRAAQRAADLGSLPPGAIAAARALAVQVGTAVIPGPQPVEMLRNEARNAGLEQAVSLLLEVVARTDDPADWRALAIAARRLRQSDAPAARELGMPPLAAAVNAYLRAVPGPQEASTLVEIARALEAVGDGRGMIPILRLAADRSSDAETMAALDRARRLYGFRVVEHSVEAESPRPRICITFSDPLAGTAVDYAPFVRIDGADLPVSAADRRLCIDGATHGETARITLRQGLPARDGEMLHRSATLDVYVRDRSPAVRFPGRGHVLARDGAMTVPLIGVNAPEARLALYRIGPRGLAGALRDQVVGQPLSRWGEQRIADTLGTPVWEGSAELATRLNEDAVTALPLTGMIDSGIEPGIYALTARVADAPDRGGSAATQWLTVTDLGLSSIRGTDGLHLSARSLSDTGPVEGAEVRVVARNNTVLGETVTDADGSAHIAPGLLRGTGGMAPETLTVTTADDFAWLDLTTAAFDLSDRGVEGRPAPGPIDLFAATDRGAYRPGETVNLTVLARNSEARAIAGLPLTAKVLRPDGVEAARAVLADAGAGGRAFSWPVPGDAMRGTWQIALHTDPEAPALTQASLLVEDFVPERLAVALSYPEGPADPDDPGTLGISARYLYGATAPGLSVSGDVTYAARREHPDHPGYFWGRHDARPAPVFESFAGPDTDATGSSTVTLPDGADLPDRGLLGMTVAVRLRDASGRPVERVLERPVRPRGPRIGLRPLFDNAVPEGGNAGFDVIAIGPAGRVAAESLRWTLSRIETDYQWYETGGSWRWEPFTSRVRVAAGTIGMTADGAPARIEAPVSWGRYELTIADASTPGAEVSHVFSAGWYAADAGTETPDRLEVSLDRDRYAPGDTARLRLVTQAGGTAMVSVLSDRVVEQRAVAVGTGETVLDLPVTEQWSPGAYVAVSLLTPFGTGDGSGDAAEGSAPARALGLAHAGIEPGPLRLEAALDLPAETRPRQTVEIALDIDGIQPGETAYATISAVDLGILNLTGHPVPDADGWYLGRRRLGTEIRDLYGALIEPGQGAPGRLRSGGDGGGGRTQAPPPTEPLVATFSGVVQAGPDGRVRLPVDLPDFNGTVRVSAIVWSETGTGHASAEMLVRDPVVVTTAAPRTLRPGDSSRVLVEFAHIDGAAGGLEVAATTSPGLTLAEGSDRATLTLGEQGRASLSLGIAGAEEGRHSLTLAITLPDGTALSKTVPVEVRRTDPPVRRSVQVALGPGDRITVDAAMFDGLAGDTARAIVTAGPRALLDVAGARASLAAYPYGCTEQTVSGAMAHLVFPGPGGSGTEIGDAIRRVLGNQSASGAFGLWRPGAGDLWLDAYATDFLARARDLGHAIPGRGLERALENLSNAVAYAGDFEHGGEGIAYALMVLAREGRASIGDLRYYADARATAFATPLAQAQLGRALQAYGETARADAMFRLAAGGLPENRIEPATFRIDYGTPLRDAAGVLALAAEAGSQAVDREALANRIALPGHASPQELVWTLLAARALESGHSAMTLDGTPLSGPATRIDGPPETPRVLVNTGADPVTVRLTTTGIPVAPEPAGGNGYTISRAYFTLSGEPVSPDAVLQNTRLVTVLTVTADRTDPARLMVEDPLPAGFEIDNPNLIRAGDVSALGWLDLLDTAEHTEARADRFLAAIDWQGKAQAFQLAYIVRAVSPGRFHHPAAQVLDMYRPAFRARGDTGAIEVVEAAE